MLNLEAGFGADIRARTYPKLAHVTERHRRAVRLLGVLCHERLIRTNIRKRPDYRRMLPFQFESHR